MAAAIAALATLAFRANSTLWQNGITKANGIAFTEPGSSGAAANFGELLRNPGFDPPFLSVPTYSKDKGKCTGKVAYGWTDNSAWSPIILQYSLENAIVHSGPSSQKIIIQPMDGTNDGIIQIIEAPTLETGKEYELSLWVRTGKQNVPVKLCLYGGASPYTEYASRTIQAGADWKQICIRGKVGPDARFQINAWTTKNAVLYIDDASLKLVR